ncbi:hypothetical protein, unlikely [Trypanosoma brucei gambiense DAL972]|uniref:Uncharacterized protein n=1 Tax=Trypanosoma brucei gambiense (strain MHOM/CI/86/DAL972) TaxID=679716 RepID=D0A4F6_TRYB9|nr:hypothetical protein, unlikely [Trypanosoma brucei gambiense DAL972]CBH16150.1 hypothetical protein, unlikely [Trypanosoma brucei gambiense DAL972]|eukprot:XP_011778414.1 hypothetical protein, unlikely [Trypanosoma brucei gambiense DAL972]
MRGSGMHEPTLRWCQHCRVASDTPPAGLNRSRIYIYIYIYIYDIRFFHLQHVLSVAHQGALPRLLYGIRLLSMPIAYPLFDLLSLSPASLANIRVPKELVVATVVGLYNSEILYLLT